MSECNLWSCDTTKVVVVKVQTGTQTYDVCITYALFKPKYFVPFMQQPYHSCITTPKITFQCTTHQATVWKTFTPVLRGQYMYGQLFQFKSKDCATTYFFPWILKTLLYPVEDDKSIIKCIHDASNKEE